MTSITEGRLRFDFPSTWDISKYDDWPYYRNQFQDSCCGNNKAVDILALDSNTSMAPTLWLIEVKDFRIAPRTKPEPLWDEAAIKVRDTLAGLLAAKLNSAHSAHDFASRSVQAGSLRIVLHLEQVTKHSKIRPRDFDIANVQQKLKQLVKPIDAHPLVLEKSQMLNAAWTASQYTGEV